ncbi:MAG: hypothetical protein Ta2D_01730 [Rickettsiales bacterium]|nr:MAG: hypothetical protein Ta2D_01730 [Rickettsiales bacterium]
MENSIITIINLKSIKESDYGKNKTFYLHQINKKEDILKTIKRDPPRVFVHHNDTMSLTTEDLPYNTILNQFIQNVKFYKQQEKLCN